MVCNRASSTAPFFIYDFNLPTVISDYIQQPGNSDAIRGSVPISAHGPINDWAPIQLGRIAMNRESIFGDKIRTQLRTGVPIPNKKPTIYAEGKLGAFARPRNEYELLSTRYLLYSCGGFAFPFGLPNPPAGYGHTLIFGNFNGLLRSLTLKE